MKQHQTNMPALTDDSEALRTHSAGGGIRSAASQPLPAVRTMLIWVVIACLLPAAIGIGALVSYLYQDGLANLQQRTLRTTHVLAMAIDDQLDEALTAAEMLATSRYVREHDWVRFHARANKLLETRNSGRAVIVTDANGQQIVNTNRPVDRALPMFDDLEQIRRVALTGKPVISNLFSSALTGQHMIAVSVPAFADGKVGKVGLVISVVIPAQQLNLILEKQQLPPQWVAGIIDSNGTILARTLNPEQLVGTKATTAYAQQMRTQALDGMFELTTIEGIPSLVFYNRSALSNWSVVIAIPRADLEAQLMRSLAFFALGIIVLFAAGIALALFVGGRISRSVQALKENAGAMGSERMPPSASVHFREAEDVAQAMTRSAGALAQRTQSLQQSLTSLKASEENYRFLVDGSPDAIVLHQDAKILYANPAFVAFAGDCSPQEWMGKSLLDSIDLACHPTVLARMKLLSDMNFHAVLPIIDIVCRKLDGTRFHAEIRCVQIDYHGQRAVHTTLRDITLRMQAEEERERFFTLSQDLLLTASFDGAIKDVNPAWIHTLGYTREQLLAMPYVELVHPDDRAATLAAAGDLANGNTLLLFENRYRCLDGSYRWLQWSATPSSASQLLYCVARDITESKQADAERVAEALFNRQLLAQLPIGVALRTVDGHFIDVNPAFAAILGLPREQVVGMTHVQISTPRFKLQDAEQSDILHRTGRYGPYEKEYLHADGSCVAVRVSGQHVKKNGETLILSVAEDISEKRKAEFRLAQAQKMDAIGQLTGGLAHDFNNMLGVIIGNLDLLAGELNGELNGKFNGDLNNGRADGLASGLANGQASALADKPSGDSRLKARIDTALMAALRGADLTRALMSVARKQSVDSEPVDLNARLNELLPLLRHTAGSNINISMALAAGLVVQVDSGGLASTLLNLVINARDAMPDGGRLTLSTRLRVVLPGDSLDTLAAGHYALLCVTDTGSGMSADVMASAMLPFFTTKERGRGTGLGLAMAHGFVKQCGGELLLYSEPGHGTTVTLMLPLPLPLPLLLPLAQTEVASAAGETQVSAPRNVAASTLAHGTERVLIVDDEIELLAVTASWLKMLGYDVTPCISAASALTAQDDAIARGNPYALMVSDVIMPGVDGFALANAARARQPGLALLYVSGFADAADRGHERPLGDILEKPFRQAELATRVRHSLDRQSGTESE